MITSQTSPTTTLPQALTFLSLTDHLTDPASKYAISTLTLLSGGSSHFTYRAELVRPLSISKDGLKEEAKTMIVKHGKGWLPVDEAFKIDLERVHFEKTMLESLSSFPPVSSHGVTISPPILYHHDELSSTHFLSDLPTSTPSLNLKTYLIKRGSTLSSTQTNRLGSALGEWLAHFHSWGNSQEVVREEVRVKMEGNTAMVEMKLKYFVGRIGDAIRRFPGELEGCEDTFRKAKEYVDESRRGVKAGDGGYLVHGDFWPGNIVIPDVDLKNDTSSVQSIPIYVVDYELSRLEPARAGPAADVSQCLAELYLISHFSLFSNGDDSAGNTSGIEVAEALVRGYREAGGIITKRIAYEALLLIGVHFLGLSINVGWEGRRGGEGKGWKELVRLGRKCVEVGFGKMEGWENGLDEEMEIGKRFVHAIFE